MNARPATRLVLPALLLGSSLAVACFDDSIVENQDCASADDCANGQECVVTQYQAATGAMHGWCRPKNDGCAAGLQPGCECSVDGIQQCCDGAEEDVLPFVDAGTCICVFRDDPNYVSMEDAEGSRCFTPTS